MVTRAVTTGDELPLPPVTHGPSRSGNWGLLGTTPALYVARELGEPGRMQLDSEGEPLGVNLIAASTS
jgi:hypothetical protein